MAERITVDLRRSMGDVSDKMDAIDAVVAGLEAENAKLRELIQYEIDNAYCDEWVAGKAAKLGIEASEHTVHVKPKKPTAEDVLEEYARAFVNYWKDESGQTPDPTADFAKRLRLAGDAE